MDKKEKRHEAIKKLITQAGIQDQQALVSKLQELYGIETNQSIVSRDLRNLNIGKHIVDGKSMYALETFDARREILRLAITTIEHNEALIVIKTLPGLADFVGDYIDFKEVPGVLGTLAGENIVFITPVSTKSIQKTFAELCKKLSYNPTHGKEPS